MIKYLIFKDGTHVATCNTPEEADDAYLKWDADEIREYEEDSFNAYNNVQNDKT